MERLSFTFEIRSGTEAECKKRHDEIWPELVDALKAAGRCLLDANRKQQRPLEMLGPYAVRRRRERTARDACQPPVARSAVSPASDVGCGDGGHSAMTVVNRGAYDRGGPWLITDRVRARVSLSGRRHCVVGCGALRALGRWWLRGLRFAGVLRLSCSIAAVSLLCSWAGL